MTGEVLKRPVEVVAAPLSFLIVVLDVKEGAASSSLSAESLAVVATRRLVEAVVEVTAAGAAAMVDSAANSVT